MADAHLSTLQFGHLLVARGWLRSDELDAAYDAFDVDSAAEPAAQQRAFVDFLAERGWITPEQQQALLAEALATDTPWSGLAGETETASAPAAAALLKQALLRMAEARQAGRVMDVWDALAEQGVLSSADAVQMRVELAGSLAPPARDVELELAIDDDGSAFVSRRAADTAKPTAEQAARAMAVTESLLDVPLPPPVLPGDAPPPKVYLPSFEADGDDAPHGVGLGGFAEGGLHGGVDTGTAANADADADSDAASAFDSHAGVDCAAGADADAGASADAAGVAEGEIAATLVAKGDRSRGSATVSSRPTAKLSESGVRADSGAGLPTRMGFGNLVALDGAKPTGRERMGRYAILSRIGKGGMGDVLEARDSDLNRAIAMKVMLAGPSARRAQVEKFLIEAQVTGQLEHPNIVPVHELGTAPDGRVYFTMKYVRGRSLQAILKELRRRADPKRKSKDPAMPDYSLTDLLEIFLKICDGVGFAHSKGVVHRDLKPENVMVGEYGEVLVMDWGLAKVQGVAEDRAADSVMIDLQAGEVSTRSRGSHADVVKTMDGTILGTPAYMPPEQARGDIGRIDHRSDIYSLGAMLYQILTLEVPFTGKSAYETLVKVVNGELIPPSQRTPERRIPQELEALVLKAMAGKREARYPNVAELQADVRAFIEGRTLSAVHYSSSELAWKWVKRNQARVIGVAAAVLVAAVSVAVLLYMQSRALQLEVANELRQANDLFNKAETLRDTADDVFAHAATTLADGGLPDIAAAEAAYDQARAKYREAADQYLRVQAKDPRNTDAVHGASLTTSRLETLTTLLDERRAEARRVEQQIQLRRQAHVAGAARLADAQQALRHADAGYEQARQELYLQGLREDGLPRLEPDFDRYDEAAELIALAAGHDANNEAIQQAATQIAARRSQVRTEWRRELELARRNQQAERHHEQGRHALTAADALMAEEPETSEAIERTRADAFGRYMKALIDFDRALEAFTQVEQVLAHDAPDGQMVGAVRERRLAAQTDKARTLLGLGWLALRNREFTIAQAWLHQTDGLVGRQTDIAEAVARLRKELEREQASAEQYVAALERAREAAAAERYAAALDQYTVARTLNDSPDLRAEIRAVQFSYQLQQGDANRAEGNWRIALATYEEARETATTPTQRQDVNRRMAALREEAGRALLRQARALLDDPDPEAPAAARRVLEQLAELAPETTYAEQALLLRSELAARDVTPPGFVYVSGGEVILGGTVASDRNPPRRLWLDSFYMAMHEVTVAEYSRFIEAGGYEQPRFWGEAGWRWLQALPREQRMPLNWSAQRPTPTHPIVGVSAYEAEAYAAWRTEVADPINGAGPAYRLPTEAEWELVARHTPAERLSSGRRYPWGNEWAAGGYSTGEARGELRPVGSQPEDESAFRVRDLAGNASEWVRLLPGGADSEAVPDGHGTRGGSSLMRGWELQRFASVTKRGFVDSPGTREPELGFRLVRDLPRSE